MESRFPNVTRLPYKVVRLSDNRPGHTANETVRFGRAIGLEVFTTASYSPESNGMDEAFVKTFKRDYVAFGDLSSAAKVLEQLTGWFVDYNEHAPHEGPAVKSPREY